MSTLSRLNQTCIDRHTRACWKSGSIAAKLASLVKLHVQLLSPMNESRLQITLSLSESVVQRVDELLLETGMQSRGAFIDCLLREVLFNEEQPQVT
jgi:hypothetical protein